MAEGALAKTTNPKGPDGGALEPNLGTMISLSPLQLQLLVDAARLLTTAPAPADTAGVLDRWRCFPLRKEFALITKALPCTSAATNCRRRRA